MRVVVCGARGSTPAPGAAFAGYGGHTSCVALAHDGAPPSLVLDAGTGLRALTALFEGGPFRGTILLGHLHWDHTQGLPFFAAADRDDASVHVALPAQDGRSALEVLTRVMSPPHFPIRPDELRGSWTFTSLEEGSHDLEGFAVVAREIPHKGGRTFGFRITDGRGASLAYLSDHGPRALGEGPSGHGPLHPAAMDLAAGVDLLVHDAQHTTDELAARWHHGHSAAEYAAELGAAAGARRVLLFHHDPSHDDPQVAALARSVADAHPDLVVDAAREGMVIDL